MEKLEALDKAYKEITRKKKTRGYKYGETDCVTLFKTYDSYLRGADDLLKIVTDYQTPRAFHNSIKKLGFNDFKGLLTHYKYKEIKFEETIAGDVCIFNSPMGDFTVCIFDGVNWINSSDDPKYERLPSRYVRTKAEFVCRLEEL